MSRRWVLLICLSWFGGACDDDTEPLFCDPRPEECNGHDDDCDEEIDEADDGGVLLRDCSNLCGSGQEECAGGVWGSCSAPQPTNETCNGFDDNCNGLVDDSDDCACVHGTSRACGTDVGECEGGTEHCDHGEWGDCLIAYDPTEHTEICDDLDNDCDGSVDEDCDCTPNETRSCGSSVGECELGTMTCSSGGRWGLCLGDQGPRTEVCDGLDNDCDGSADRVLSAGIGWSTDDHESNDSCQDAAPFFGPGGVAEIPEGSGWVSVPNDDPGNLDAYPSLYAIGDEDWFSTRVVEGDRGFCWPWDTMCAYVLRVQLTLLDLYHGRADQDPDDYQFCVITGDCMAQMEEGKRFCTRASNWNAEGSYYSLMLVWGAGCGEASRDLRIQVLSPTGEACGHYNLWINWDYDSDRECP